MTYKSAVQANGFRYGALDFTLSAVSTTRPTFFEISPTADFAPSTVRPCLRASTVTALSTSPATSVARAVCSAASQQSLHRNRGQPGGGRLLATLDLPPAHTRLWERMQGRRKVSVIGSQSPRRLPTRTVHRARR